MTLLEIAVFFGVSFAAAAVNSVAGGGTFLTFPVFILNGLSALQANIMSTIALWPGNLASIYGYRSEFEADRKALIPFITIGLIGGAAGAILLLSTPEVTFKRLVPWLLLIATLIFSMGRHVVALLRKFSRDGKPHVALAYAIQVVIAVYGGYFGAGIGILTLAMLQLLGHDHIHRMNAIKTVLTGVINAVIVLVFCFSGKVIWPLAGVMIAGAITGGYVGARLALRVPPQHVRVLVSIIGFSMTAYFFLHGV